MSESPATDSAYLATAAAQTRTEAEARAQIAEAGQRAFFDIVAMRARVTAEADLHDESDDGEQRCSNTGGHKFECTGTAYGGDDERWHGEGRCLCIHCGADGDA